MWSVKSVEVTGTGGSELPLRNAPAVNIPKLERFGEAPEQRTLNHNQNDVTFAPEENQSWSRPIQDIGSHHPVVKAPFLPENSITKSIYSSQLFTYLIVK